MKLKLFFRSSRESAERLTDLFDFVWPTAAAMWNLRWQVRGIVDAYPKITEAELLGRFVAGSGILGANLRRTCIDKTWEDQQREFSRFLLFEICSLYEAWCEGCLAELGCSSTKLSKQLQRPTTTASNGSTEGVGYVISQFASTPSLELSAALQTPLSTNRKNSKSNLDSLMVCYRYFKEARNALVHSGGSPSQWFFQAETEYSRLTPVLLGVKEVPAFNMFVAGQPLVLSLRGVVGFGDIVLRLICTLDVELAQSAAAENVFVRRWKARHGSAPVVISTDAQSRLARIRRLVKKLDLPTPIVSPSFDTWLKNMRLVV